MYISIIIVVILIVGVVIMMYYISKRMEHYPECVRYRVVQAGIPQHFSEWQYQFLIDEAFFVFEIELLHPFLVNKIEHTWSIYANIIHNFWCFLDLHMFAG